MKITALVENRSNGELKAEHGLSLYIETEKHKILFDLGSANTLFENSKQKGIDLSAVDIVIISHGHRDHGGAIYKFLQINKKKCDMKQLPSMAHELSNYDVIYYTCHCTGLKAFNYFKEKVKSMNYLSCGDEIDI